MTAEVVILNKRGLLLAADSAVTTGGTAEASAKKIFRLSKSAPIAAMIYHSERLLKVPWADIFHQYSDYIDGKKLASLEAYANDLFLFLGGRPFGKEVQLEYIASNTKLLVREIVTSCELAYELYRARGGSNAIREFTLDFISIELAELMSLNQMEGLPQEFCSAIQPACSEALEELLSDSPLRDFKEGLALLAAEALMRKPAHLCSGVVLAGYGEGEQLPQLMHYVVNGVAEDRVLYKRLESISIVDAEPLSVAHFAKAKMDATMARVRFAEAGIRIDESPMADLVDVVEQYLLELAKEDPSVKGPIDVAILTKENGFEWIKEKNRTA